jgi:hypothetical protein
MITTAWLLLWVPWRRPRVAIALQSFLQSGVASASTTASVASQSCRRRCEAVTSASLSRVSVALASPRHREGVPSRRPRVASARVPSRCHRIDLASPSRWRLVAVASALRRLRVTKFSHRRRVSSRRDGITLASPRCRRRVGVASPLRSRHLILAVWSASRLFCVPFRQHRVAVSRHHREGISIAVTSSSCRRRLGFASPLRCHHVGVVCNSVDAASTSNHFGVT